MHRTTGSPASAWLAAPRRIRRMASTGLRALTEAIRRLDETIIRWALRTGTLMGPDAAPVRDEYRTGRQPAAPHLSLDPWSECPTCQALGRDGW